MKSVNKVILLGNLTRDPELRYTENKKAVCAFGLATNRNWTTDTGEKREETEFHRIVAWDKLAETCQQFLRKGRKVYVEGRLQSHTYTGQDGVEKTGVEIVLEDLVFVDPMPKEVQEALRQAKA
jgi:single-strand DNA-binding protein